MSKKHLTKAQVNVQKKEIFHSAGNVMTRVSSGVKKTTTKRRHKAVKGAVSTVIKNLTEANIDQETIRQVLEINRSPLLEPPQWSVDSVLMTPEQLNRMVQREEARRRQLDMEREAEERARQAYLETQRSMMLDQRNWRVPNIQWEWLDEPFEPTPTPPEPEPGPEVQEVNPGRRRIQVA